MLERLTLHTGPFKTGTTTIQAALAASAVELEEAGVLVPLSRGTYPGLASPILRDLLSPDAYDEINGYSRDELPLDEVETSLAQSGASHLLLSGEHFGDPAAEPGLRDLVERLRPQVIRTVQVVRDPMSWMLSWYAQEVRGGFTPAGVMSVEVFSRHFVSHLLPGSLAVRDRIARLGVPWESAVIVLPTNNPASLTSMFARAAGLPLTLAAVPATNERISSCEMHLLLHVNAAALRDLPTLRERGQARGLLQQSLEGRGVPPHDCQCADSVDPRVVADVSTRGSAILGTFLKGTTVTGDVSLLEVDAGREWQSARAPRPDMAPRWVVDVMASALNGQSRLVDALSDLRGWTSELEAARDWWRTQAEANNPQA